MNTRVTSPTVETGQQLSPQHDLYLNWYMELADGTVLDNSSLRLVSFNGQDTLSNLFSFTLQLHGNTDFDVSQYKLNELIGRMISVGVCEKDAKHDLDNGPFHPPYFSDNAYDGDFQDAVVHDKPGNFSFFNGMVAGFSLSEPGVYSLTMKPAMWKLTLTNDYKVFPHKSIRQVIEEVLGKHQVACNTKLLEGMDNSASFREQDWLQAGESDFDFIQRLLGKSNIHFYFQHSPRSHKAVFSNRASYPPVFPDGRKLKYTFSQLEGVEQADCLLDYQYSQNISASSVEGCFTRQEGAWESDTVAGEASFYSDAPGNKGNLPFHLYNILQYGGSTDWVNEFSSQLAEMAASAASELHGTTNNANLKSGHKLQLEEGEHSGPPQVNPFLDNNWFVCTDVEFQASLDGTCTSKFKATEAKSLVTPFDPHSTHQGSVLAEVVAHGNGTMPKTWKYYEKSVFDPERSPETDENAGNSGVIGGIDPAADANPVKLMAQGVYVRFTAKRSDEPVFIKLGATMQTCPEIGSIVLVARAADESELPEVQQIIQANGTKVVTPSGWTANTHWGSSYSTSYGDGKSIHYGANSATDLDNAIAIVENEYKTGEFRDSGYSKGGSYSYSTSEQGRAGMLSKSDSFGNTYSSHQGDISQSFSDITLQDSVSINGTVNSVSTINVGSTSSHHNLGFTTSTNQVDGLSKSTNIQADVETSNTTNGTMTSDNTFNGKVTDSTVHNADVENTSTNNGNITTTSTHTGNLTSTNTITGETVTTSTNTGDVTNTSTTTGTETSNITRNVVKSTTKTTSSSNTSNIGSSSESSTIGSATHDSKTGTSTSSTMVGASASSSIVGASANSNILGASADSNIAGVRVGMNIAGTTNDMNITGMRNAINITGLENSINLTGSGISLNVNEVISINSTGMTITLEELLMLL